MFLKFVFNKNLLLGIHLNNIICFIQVNFLENRKIEIEMI